MLHIVYYTSIIISHMRMFYIKIDSSIECELYFLYHFFPIYVPFPYRYLEILICEIKNYSMYDVSSLQ